LGLSGVPGPQLNPARWLAAEPQWNAGDGRSQVPCVRLYGNPVRSPCAREVWRSPRTASSRYQGCVLGSLLALDGVKPGCNAQSATPSLRRFGKQVQHLLIARR
jgi:hypothetical protein